MSAESTARPFTQRINGSLRVLGAVGFICAVLCLLRFSDEVQSSVKNSITYCLGVLVPSLFPFMVITSYAVNSGVSEVFGRWLGVIVRRVFKLPEVCAAPIIMSFIGGYPAGARAVSTMLAQGKITDKQAARMLLFCVNPGIAFVVTFLGGTVLGSSLVGWLIFLSVTAAGLVLGVISGLRVQPPKALPEQNEPSGGALVRSVSDAASAVLKMCACIVIFSGFTAILHGAGIYQTAARLLARTGLFSPTDSAVVLSFLIEVTGGAGTAAKFRAGAPLYTFGVAFGGLCVHMQLFSFFGVFPCSRRKFFLFRLLHGLLSSAIYRAIAAALPERFTAVVAPIGAVSGIASLSGTLAGGLSLVLMCMAFLVITAGNER